MFYIFLLILIVWEIYWKYHAMWLASHKEDKSWFLLLLVINTMGLIPLYYLYKNNYFKT